MDAPSSDHDLLDAWRAGDGAAGDVLVQRHFAALFRFFRNKLDDALAEDLTQATLLACVDNRDRFRDVSSFRAYLFGIARNQLNMYFRGRSVADRVIEFTTASVADLGTSPSGILGARGEQQLLLIALRRIPVDFQIVVELYYWEDLSTRELAEVLGVPEGTIRSRLARAREQLATHMAALADSPELARSTIDGFEAWARSLREPAA